MHETPAYQPNHAYLYSHPFTQSYMIRNSFFFLVIAQGRWRQKDFRLNNTYRETICEEVDSGMLESDHPFSLQSQLP
jgi:hypothetical protein